MLTVRREQFRYMKNKYLTRFLCLTLMSGMVLSGPASVLAAEDTAAYTAALLNAEFHSVAARSPNAFLSVPSAPFRSIGVRESLTPFANMVLPKIGLPLEDGVVKCHPRFSVPRRLRRSQRCWEYPSKHRRDRCERRALLDYFKRGGFHHHVGQPDTPPGVLGFVLVLHLMFFQ